VARNSSPPHWPIINRELSGNIRASLSLDGFEVAGKPSQAWTLCSGKAGRLMTSFRR